MHIEEVQLVKILYCSDNKKYQIWNSKLMNEQRLEESTLKKIWKFHMVYVVLFEQQHMLPKTSSGLHLRLILPQCNLPT